MKQVETMLIMFCMQFKNGQEDGEAWKTSPYRKCVGGGSRGWEEQSFPEMDRTFCSTAFQMNGSDVGNTMDSNDDYFCQCLW